MAEEVNTSHLDLFNGNDDVLNKSWDVESRYRLQEKALRLGKAFFTEESARFQVQVELGLHELTAALTSLSRRVDKLEESTAPTDGAEQDQAMKDLARSARCLSQALPGIASARTRRRALHGYFRESDGQRGSESGGRIDPATRALVVEGLSCLAGKVRADTACGSNIAGGDMGSSLGRSGASWGMSHTFPRRRKSPTRSTKVGQTPTQGIWEGERGGGRRGGRAGRGEGRGVIGGGVGGAGGGSGEEHAPQNENCVEGAGREAAGLGGWFTGSSREARQLESGTEGFFLSRDELAHEGLGLGLGLGLEPNTAFAPGTMEIDHLGGLGASVPPSPITLAGSVDGNNMLPPTRSPKAAKDTNAIAREQGRSGGGKGSRGGRKEGAGLSKTGSGRSRQQRGHSAGECTGIDAGGGAGRGEPASSAERAASPNGVMPPPPSRLRINPDSVSTAGAGKGKSVTKLVERVINYDTPHADEADSAGVRSTGAAGGGCGMAASHRDLCAAILLNATGAAVDVEERASEAEPHFGRRRSGQGATDESGTDDVGGGSEDGFGRRADVEAVRALSRRGRHRVSRASPPSSSSSSYSTDAVNSPAVDSPALAAAGVGDAGTTREAGQGPEADGFESGKIEAAAAGRDGSSSLNHPHHQCPLDLDGCRKPKVGDVPRSSSLEGWPASYVGGAGVGASPFVDAQGFFDLGAATTDGTSLAVLEQAEGKSVNHPDRRGSDPRITDLEAKLGELIRIGDRLKEEAAASTAEPSVTIPSQDLTGLDLSQPHPDFEDGRAATSGGSRFQSTSPNWNNLERLIRGSGGLRAHSHEPPSHVAAAAAPSAFTSAESSPGLAPAAAAAAEHLPSTTAAAAAASPPSRPEDHPSTAPALSRLLVPPFGNAALRGDFIASLERHLAEYEGGSSGGDGTTPAYDVNGEVEADGRGDGCGSNARRTDGGGRLRQDSDMVAACDGGEDSMLGAGAGGGGNSCGGGTASGSGSGNGSGTFLATTTTVRGVPAAPRLAEAGRARAGSSLAGGSKVETAALGVKPAARRVSGGRVTGLVQDEGKEEGVVVQEPAPRGGEGGTKRPASWAQEYHDYLCSKEA